MTYLVTGGTGLLASRIVRNLARQGETIIAHDLSPDTGLMDFVLGREESQRVKIVQGDILDYDALLGLCKTHGVGAIVHTASMLGNAAPRRSVQINTGGIINVLEAARELGMRKVVYAGTNAVFNPANTGLIANDASFDPENMYGATKVFNEHAANLYFRDFGVDVTGVRISAMLFGAGQKRGISSTMATEAMLKPAVGEPGRVLYDDSWSWLYVEEAARAMTMATKLKRERGMAGCYNLRGTVIPFSELIAYVKKLLPEAEISMVRGSLNKHYHNMDMTVTERELGYVPQWDVWDAIRETINQTRAKAGLSPV